MVGGHQVIGGIKQITYIHVCMSDNSLVCVRLTV